MRNRMVSCALAVAAVLGSGLVAAAPASADSYNYIPVDNISHPNLIAGTMSFTSYGDKLKVVDSRADGYAVHVTVEDYTLWKKDGKTHTIYTLTVGGYGNHKTVSAKNGGVYNLPEGHELRFWRYRTAAVGAQSWDRA